MNMAKSEFDAGWSIINTQLHYQGGSAGNWVKKVPTLRECAHQVPTFVLALKGWQAWKCISALVTGAIRSLVGTLTWARIS